MVISRQSQERQAILSAMRHLGRPASPGEVAAYLGWPKQNNVVQLMRRMAIQDDLDQVAYGKYALPEREKAVGA